MNKNMATAKKPTTKKAPARPANKTTVKRVTKKQPKRSTEAVRSFTPVWQTEPFMTFRVSNQTVYWLILSGFVLLLGLWVVNINDKVQRIYDQIDETNSAIFSAPEPKLQGTAR